MQHADSAPLRVLVIAQYDPTIDWVEAAMQEQNFRVIERVDSVEKALRDIQKTLVDVILADSSGDGVVDTEWIRSVVIDHGVNVLVMATKSEMDFIREAMLAGAQSFLLKPFDTTELFRSIAQVYQLGLQRQASFAKVTEENPPAPSGKKAHTIAVFSPKGGTGVTTLAVNLAVALKQQTRVPVLLVDADLRTADVDIFLNVYSKYSILDVIRLDQKVNPELLKSVTTEHATGLTVIRGDSRLQFVEAPIDPGQMGDLIEEIISSWEGYIVINTTNSLDRWTVEVLDLVDTVLLTTTPELPALRVVRGFLDLAEAESDLTGKWQMVMTSYQNQKAMRMSDIEASIRFPIKATIASDPVLASTSINRGRPLLLSHEKSAVARDINALAKQLVEAYPQPATQAAGRKNSGSAQDLDNQQEKSGKRFGLWQSITNSIRLPAGQNG